MKLATTLNLENLNVLLLTCIFFTAPKKKQNGCNSNTQVYKAAAAAVLVLALLGVAIWLGGKVSLHAYQ